MTNRERRVDPDEKKRYNPITAMMIESAYKTLVYEANQLEDSVLEKRVHFILDEFGNMAKIPNFDGKMTVARSRNILFHLYLQGYEQMNEKYGDHIAHIIRSNCNLWYFISSADHDVCKSILVKKILWLNRTVTILITMLLRQVVV